MIQHFGQMRARPLPALAFLVATGRLFGFQAAVPNFQSKSQEVILDLVVRNKHGDAVRDLNQSDIQIYEDGRLQEIKSINLIDPSRPHDDSVPALLGDGKAPVRRNGVGEMRFVSLIFDRLTGSAQRNALAAINELLTSALPRDTYVAVLVLDRNLYLLQPFTNDSKRVQEAALRAISGLPSQYVRDSERNLTQLEELYLKNDVIGLSQMDLVLLRTLRDSVRDTRSEQGRAQLGALLSLVRYQSSLAGRKAVVYFSQGLVIPPAMRELFDSLTVAANRGRVSFYTLDTRGLDGTPTAAPRNRLAQALESGTIHQGEWQPESLHSELDSTRMALDELAANTGGFLSATNDVRAPLHRVWDDLHTYYEVTYRPAWSEYDGRFHKITVHLVRRGLAVLSRDGYYALPDLGGRTMLPYESELLGLLSARPLPASLASSSAVVCYRLGKMDRCVLTLSVPLKDLKPSAADAGARRLAFLALVRNASGEVVDVLSRDLLVGMPADRQKSKPTMGTFTRVERFDLAPGRYTVEIAIQDRESMVVSAKNTSLYVREFQPLDASEIVGIRNLLPREGARTAADPLEFGELYVTPDPSSTFEKRQDATPKLYFIAYPAADSTAKVELLAKIIGTSAESAPEPAPAISAGESSAGAIPCLISIPVQSLDPGDYVLEVTLMQGDKSIQRVIAFKVLSQ